MISNPTSGIWFLANRCAVSVCLSRHSNRAAIRADAQRADGVAVAARLGQGIRDGVVEVVACRSLLDVGIERGELLAHLRVGGRRVVCRLGGIEGHGLERWPAQSYVRIV